MILPSKKPHVERVKKALLWVGLGSYVISLFLPIAVGPEIRPEAVPGGLVLILGSISFIGAANPSWCGLSWLANPMLLLCLVSSRRPTIQKLSALLALLLACLYLGVKAINVNEAGLMAQASPGPAYWFWLQAIALINLWSWTPPPQQRGA